MKQTCGGICAIALFVVACGGTAIEYQSPGRGEGTDGGTSGRGDGKTLGTGADYQTVPNNVADDTRLQEVVGSAPNDLWGGFRNHLWHYDGNAWSEVVLPAPLSAGNIDGEGLPHLASAGPGKVWIAHAYAVARVDMTGKVEDFTAQVPHGPMSDVFVDAGPTGAAIVMVVDAAVPYAFDGAAFRPMPAFPPSDYRSMAYLRVLGVNDVWAMERIFDGYLHFNGTAWQRQAEQDSSPPGGSARNALVHLPIIGEVCPDWCHPDTPPHGQTTRANWSGTLRVPVAGGAFQAVTLDIPAPTDLDGSIAYRGQNHQIAKSGRLALLGCAFPSSDVSKASPSRGHLIVQEWDASGLHARALANPPPCINERTGESEDGQRPLLDGTWVVPTGGMTDLVILMAP